MLRVLKAVLEDSLAVSGVFKAVLENELAVLRNELAVSENLLAVSRVFLAVSGV